MSDIIVGIDLGTTNSEVAAFVDGKPRIIGNAEQLMLPSCVGLAPNGELLIGESARNQRLLYPERTIRSVKRLMGSDEPIKLGEKTFTPPEISALILRELARWAENRLGEPVKKAVITVPAYFSDAQRSATREAGALAGLEVVRIVNEPTAASLAYGLDRDKRHTVMVYDLGGGTFDVSVVRVEGEVTEVLASHGNNRLGGDDFDQKLVDHLLGEFQKRHNVDLRDQHPGAYARLWWAAESAKKQLSYEPYARVLEEALVTIDGRPLNLDVEISREQYEEMIRPLLDQTLDSVSKALNDSGMLPAALDAVVLVGGSTRTPLVVKLLEQICGKPPRQDLHPDLCVALGAGILASRLGGHQIEQILVDVSPYSFGISYLGEIDGYESPHCYHPVIRRNTPLPVTRTEEYFTSYSGQIAVKINVYQGDDPHALRNVHVGQFMIEGLRPMTEYNSVLCRMRLDLDGILHVTAIEKETGLSKHVAITGATRQRDAAELTRGREQLERLFTQRITEDNLETIQGVAPIEQSPTDAFGALQTAVGVADDASIPQSHSDWTPAATEESSSPEARELLERCRGRLASMHDEDREEAVNLIEDVETAIRDDEKESLATAISALREFLFFVEGH